MRAAWLFGGSQPKARFEFLPAGIRIFLMGVTSMKHSKISISNLTVLTLAFLLFAERNATAYTDPGTASLLLQWLIAGIVGASFVARIYWHKLKAFFTGKALKEENENEEL